MMPFFFPFNIIFEEISQELIGNANYSTLAPPNSRLFKAQQYYSNLNQIHRNSEICDGESIFWSTKLIKIFAKVNKK